MKAILVIDMPTSCRECPCGDWNICSAIVKTHTNKMSEQREAWCPLKPMPEKLRVDVNQIEDVMPSEFDMDKLVLKIRLDADKLVALGWNTCLEEIEK